MIDFTKAKIYRIYSTTNPNLVYYGSTCKEVSQRVMKHKFRYTSYLNGKSRYVSSFIIIALGDYDAELVENYPCENVVELRKRERYYIENFPCVNKNIPTRTRREYDKYCYDINKYGVKDKFKNLPQIICCCGGHYINRRNRHLQSTKHIKYLETTNNLLSPNNITNELQES
jgi:hypothetical protein